MAIAKIVRGALAMLGAGVIGAQLFATEAAALDQVKVGVFPVSASLPFFVALDRGYFREQGIEPVPTRMQSSTLIIQAFLAGELATAAALVTTEGLNVNNRTPNPIVYMSLNGQNAENRQETIVVRRGLDVASIRELKGRASKIMSASGPANVAMARAVLKANGLEDGKDFVLSDLALNLHVGAIQAGTFDAGYTLEPAGTILKKNGGGVEVEGGVIATYILGRKDAFAFAAGGAMTSKFLKERPDVARRWAVAYRKALETIRTDPTARDHLAGNTPVPPEVVREVGIPAFFMVDQLSDQNMWDYQSFIDFAHSQGIVTEKTDVKKYLVTLDR